MDDTLGFHRFNGFCCLVGSVSLSGLSARLARAGWTPETVVSAVGAVGMLVLALVQFLKALWPYFDRAMALLERRQPPVGNPYSVTAASLRGEAAGVAATVVAHAATEAASVVAAAAGVAATGLNARPPPA